MFSLSRMCLLIALAQPLTGYALTPETKWSQAMTVGKDQNFILKTILPARDNGLAVFGTLANKLSFKQEFRIQFLNSKGATQSVQSLPSPDSSTSLHLVDAVAGLDHEFYTVQSIHYGNLDDQSDTQITHLSPSGSILWQVEAKGQNALSNYAIAALPDREGGVIIAGIDTLAITAHGIQNQCFFQHYSREGQLLWEQNVADLDNCSPSSFGSALALDADGSLYAALENGLIKFDSAGRELWRITKRSFAVRIFQNRIYVTSPQETWAAAFDGTLLWSLPNLGGVYLEVADDGLWTAGTAFSEKGDMRLQLHHILSDGQLDLQRNYLTGVKSLARGMMLNTQHEPIVFVDLWSTQGLLKVPQQSMSLLGFDRQGQDLWHAQVKGSISGASFLPLGDQAFIVGDLVGLVSRVELVPGKPNCPWWNPWCAG